jgi:hypothetical protein
LIWQLFSIQYIWQFMNSKYFSYFYNFKPGADYLSILLRIIEAEEILCKPGFEI